MESNKPLMNRWLVVIGAILIQLCLGAIYAWSVYTAALTKAVEEGGMYGMTKSESQLPFAIGLATFALLMPFAGNWQKKSGPKVVAVTGGILLGLGYILAGIMGGNLLTQVILIGLLGGAGIGLAYVCPIAVGVKWFPDKKGLITGLAVAGFGFGATIWVKVAGGMFGWAGLMNTLNFDFCANSGVQSTWFIYGIAYAVIVLIGSIWMVNPPDDYKPAGWEPPPPSATAATGAVEFNQWQMLKTPQFYMLWFCFIAGATAGLMTIGVIKLFGIDALQTTGVGLEAAKGYADTAMGVFYALANGIGRILWGMISDKIGRNRAIFLMCLIQGLAMLSFFFVGKWVWGLWIWAIIIGFNFGGNFALYPAATADYFGNKNVGVNYGWMFLAYGVGGIVGPFVLTNRFTDLAKAAGAYDAWLWPFLIAGILSLIASGVILATKKPKPV
ncbi:MAG TPA: MFS transporter [Firmicutes bacterium]|nr:MFS transporter [Bacillota bacterium]